MATTTRHVAAITPLKCGNIMLMLKIVPMSFLLACSVAWSAGAPTPADLVAAAKTQIGVTVQYDGKYEKLAYPGGDVPIARGVCTDVLIRAYRKLGIDLQKLVHEDMAAAWQAYPRLWQLKGPDRNIDHRRVPNLQTYFTRHGQALGASNHAHDYLPGDIVTWTVSSRLPHIGIVSSEKSAAGTPLIIHNIGAGTRLEDTLFAFPITGHYRFTGQR
jgi:uncharacterized protein YijF (DUF1287 family)